MTLIQEVLSEWIDLSCERIVYDITEFSNSRQEDTRILHGIVIENLTQAKADKLQRQSGWIQ